MFSWKYPVELESVQLAWYERNNDMKEITVQSWQPKLQGTTDCVFISSCHVLKK